VLVRARDVGRTVGVKFMLTRSAVKWSRSLSGHVPNFGILFRCSVPLFKKNPLFALSPHAVHVHPLRPVGRTRIVRTSGVPVHSKGRFRSRRVVRLPC